MSPRRKTWRQPRPGSLFNTRKSLGSVDHEKGLAWRTRWVDTDYHDQFPHFTAQLDYGVPLPWSNSSIWGYASPASPGPKDSPLGSFYFGSFRNNTSITGRRNATASWRASPLRDRPDKRPALRQADRRSQSAADPLRRGRHAQLLSAICPPGLFAGTMLTRDADGKNRDYMTLGGHVDLAFTVALRLPMVFSIGAAGGFADGTMRRPSSWHP